jgi:hypothetical protein
MSICSVQGYVQGLLRDLPWPPAMAGLAPLECYVKPPDPDVQSSIPTSYVWMRNGRESRDTDKLRSGTVPRIEIPGGPSGTKAVDYRIPIFLVWEMDTADPDAASLFPGMMWQIMKALRGATYAAGAQLSKTPVLLTDPWDGEQSWLIDLGEDFSWDSDFHALEPQRTLRFDGVIDCSVSEAIAA